MRLGQCACSNTPHLNGLGQIVMQPVHGLAALEDSALAPAARVGMAGAYGGLIGGLSSGRLKGAGTGSILAAGLTAAVETAVGSNLPMGARAAYGVLSVALVGWGASRAYRAMKR